MYNKHTQFQKPVNNNNNKIKMRKKRTKNYLIKYVHNWKKYSILRLCKLKRQIVGACRILSNRLKKHMFNWAKLIRPNIKNILSVVY